MERPPQIKGIARLASAMITVLLLPASVIATTTTCGTNSTCNCQKSNEDTTVSCQHNDHPDTNLSYWPQTGYLQIECDRRCSKCHVDNLHDFGFAHTTTVDVRNCPLPKTDFSSYVNGYNISSFRFTSANERPLQTINALVFGGMSALTNLSLQSCGLMYIPYDLFRFMPSLRSVSLLGNKLTTLPKKLFAEIPELQVLDLGNNELCSLSDPLALPSLTHLYLFNNKLKTIAPKVFQISNNITHLELQGNRIETLPEESFEELPFLTDISLFTNLLRTLPPNLFAKNFNLKKVLLHDNELLSELPEQLLANHTLLEELNLFMCSFSSIPEFALQELRSLKRLDLSHNQLTTLPEKLLQDCSSLKQLRLNHNSLRKLPINLFRENKELVELYLNHNNLSELLDPFTELVSLALLDISHNQLVNLDKQFHTLKQLTELNVAYNNIIRIEADTFSSCSSLSNVILNNNNLSDADFDLPRKVTEVDISFNLLNQMPMEWEELLYIRTLNLSHNSIKSVDITNLQYKTNVDIDLRHNQLQNINMADEYESKTKPTARLGFNPLNCDCKVEYLLQHMVNQLQDRDIMVTLDIKDLQCQQPNILSGKEVTDLDKGDLVCKIPGFCPMNCSCEYRAGSKEKQVLCRNSVLHNVPVSPPRNISMLDLSGNQLKSLVGLKETYWQNLTALVLTGNHLSCLDIKILPPNLHALYIDNNSLQTLNKEAMTYLSMHPQLQVRLGHNPWICNCSDLSLQLWLETSHNVVDSNQMTCANLANTTVSRFQCHDEKRDLSSLMIGLVIASVMVSILVAFVGIAYYKYQQVIRIWLFSHGWCLYIVKEKDIDADKQFDAFVSFSQDDVEWVGHVLLPGLENQEPFYRLCIHQRNWPAGEWIPDQIERSVEASCRTIVVLSPNFLRSVWARLEFKAAYYKALKDRMNRVIIVVLGSMPPKNEMDPDMRRYVDLNTYVQYEDPWFWKKLRYAMPHNPVGSNGNSMITNQWFINPMRSSSKSTSLQSNTPESFSMSASPS